VPIKRSDEKLHVVTLTSGSQGATSSPALSHDGKRATWLEMAEDGYEAGKKRIAVYNLEEQSVFYSTDQWDFSPSSVVVSFSPQRYLSIAINMTYPQFSSDDRDIYLVAGENGRDGVWVMGLAPDTASFPVRLTREHSASSPQMLPGGRLLFTQSSFTEPNNLFVLTSSPKSLVKITNFGKEIAEQGKVLDKGEEFWVEGAEPGRQVHSWVLKPKGWKEAKENGERMTKRWPAVLLIHGGPQSAWLDAWSTRHVSSNLLSSFTQPLTAFVTPVGILTVRHFRIYSYELMF
jgi:dipeptidyl aminopeptidase/acylaminoacyl peptidase